jgi:hypothetical protein
VAGHGAGPTGAVASRYAAVVGDDGDERGLVEAVGTDP